jgi:uncharacterized DUF497 family protein
MLHFEWDPAKAASNLLKHGVSFAEAVTVLLDPLSLTDEDPTHPTEIRWLTVGTSFQARILVVVHTDDDDTVRIISARKATASERRNYEEGHEDEED